MLKTIGLEPTPLPSPHVQVLRQKRHFKGMVNIELITEHSLPRWEHEMELIHETYPDRPVLASIMAGGYPMTGRNSCSAWSDAV